MKPDRQLSTSSICLGFALVVLLVFGRLMFAEFTNWDDQHTVAQNPNLRPPAAQSVLSHWTLFEPAERQSDRVINHEFGLWVPLTYTVWSALASVAQVSDPLLGTRELNPYIFHAFNVAVHAGGGLLVFGILRLLFRSASPFAVAAGAMLFALHPLQVEATAWVSGLKDLLAGFFGLAALLAYILHADERRTVRRRRVAWWMCCILLPLATMSKPSAVTIPLLAIAIDALMLRRKPRAVMLSALPLFLVVAPFAVIARLAQNDVEVVLTPAWARPLVALDAITFYLGKLVWPWKLCIDYGRTPASLIASGQFYYTALISAAVATIAFGAAARGRRAPLVALAVFALAPLPTLGFVPFLFQFYSTTADHYLYVAMLGPAIGLTAILNSLPQATIKWATCAVLAIWAMLSFRQSGFWRDSETLFTHTLESNPRSFAAINNLAGLRPRDDPSVDVLFKRSLELQPLNIAAAVNLRTVQTELGKRDEAMATLRHEVKLKRTLPYNAAGKWLQDPSMFGEMLLARGQVFAAMAEARRVLHQQPGNQNALRILKLAEMLAGGAPASTQSAPSP